MRLLFVLPEYPPDHGGGVGTFYGALLPALAAQGHTVEAVVGSAVVSGGDAYERDGVRVRPLQPEQVERAMPSFSRYAPLPDVQRHLAAARALWEQADGGQGFDAVEVVDWGLLFAPWIAEPGPPSVVRLHSSCGQIATYDALPGAGLSSETLRHLETGLLAHADALETVSQANGAFWREQTGREVAVAPPPLRAAAPLDLPRHTAGFVAGRIQEWKGPHVLAEALSRLGPDAPTIEWAGRAVGHPRTGEPYDAVLARDYPAVWPTRLQPLGPLAPSEVTRRQAQAAFVVVPSLWDVYNLSVAEAMQQKAVVLCSDGAGGADLLDSGRNGFVFAGGDASALAEQLRRVTEMTLAERSQMGEAARETVVRVTDPERVASAAGERYAALAARPPVSAPPSWLADAVRPAAPATLDAFLSTLPLRALLSHSLGRVQAKLTSRRP